MDIWPVIFSTRFPKVVKNADNSAAKLCSYLCLAHGASMKITCYRNHEVACESRHLPHATYNLAVTLLARCNSDCLFVPIRSLQYLAILDAEEFVFVDGASKCRIDIAWRHFRPMERTSLDDPVGYEAVYYHHETALLMSRLQTEFPLALRSLTGKERLEGPARVIKFPSPGSRS
jgi:hypothetical protein